MRTAQSFAVVTALLALACGGKPIGATDSGSPGVPDAGPDEGATDAGPDAGLLGPTFVPPDPQRSGDPDAGYYQLVNGNYVSCGVPFDLYQRTFAAPPANELLPGRVGDNAKLPYNENAVLIDGGFEVVAPNCLTCHAAQINGQLWIGLGDTSHDYTTDPSGELQLAVGLETDPTEQAELQEFANRMTVIGPYTTMPVIGVNPADNLAAILFAHHDPQTLAWSDAALLPLPPSTPVPVRVPPWWRMAKKNAMFYNAAGRGDHARIMMTASTLCTDTVAQAEAIDAYFPDVEAFVESVQPPPYPFAIDSSLAASGQAVFEANCSSCHGTYGANASYPNLIVPLAEIGTDPLLAADAQFGSPYTSWYNSSFYGLIAQLEPQAGYVAPPLDGVWAITPYFHNGSVPTLTGVLDSSTRPTYWRRTFVSTDYDQTNVGWNATAETAGGSVDVYDTTQPGYSSAGHTFGDALSQSDRAALIEYLKTL